jgi:hypothetical protein
MARRGRRRSDEQYPQAEAEPKATVGGKRRRTEDVPVPELPQPSQASDVVQPAFFDDSRNVVSANAASPSGAGSATALAATAGAVATVVSEVLTCILLGRSASIREIGGAGLMRGNLHGTDHRTTPNRSDVVAQAGRNDDVDAMPVNMDVITHSKRGRE